MLRLSGPSLNVDRLISELSLEPTAVYRRGEPRFRSKPKGSINSRSGLNLTVSDAEMDCLTQQMDEAVAYLQEHSALLREMLSFDGVEDAGIDFSSVIREPFWAAFNFPPQLVAAAASLGLGLSLSGYPTETDA